MRASLPGWGKLITTTQMHSLILDNRWFKVRLFDRDNLLMRTDERIETPPPKVVTSEERRSSVVFSDVFVERRKQKEYQHAITQISERAKKLDW